MVKYVSNTEGRRKLLPLLLKYGFVIVVIILMLIMAIISPVFFSSTNILNLFRQISVTGIAALGATFVILIGEIDLSVASTIALGGVFYASLQFLVPVPFAVLLTLAITMSVGFINGLITTKGDIASFAVTLGTMGAIRGFALLYANGRPIFGLHEGSRWMGMGYAGPIPLPVIFLIVAVIVAIYTLRMTRYGRHLYAVGGNEEASYLGGLNVHMIKIMAFALAGLAAGFGGVLMTSRLGSGDPIAAAGYEFDVIAAVVIGGTSLRGGIGSAQGTLLGALLMGLITNGLNLQGVNPYWQQIAKGLIIVAAVFIDRQKRRFS